MIGFGQAVLNIFLLQGHPGNFKLQQPDLLKRFFTLLVNAAKRGAAVRNLLLQRIILALTGMQLRFNFLNLLIILLETIFIGLDLQRAGRDLPAVFGNVAGNLRDALQSVLPEI